MEMHGSSRVIISCSYFIYASFIFFGECVCLVCKWRIMYNSKIIVDDGEQLEDFKKQHT
jgi:hypothetical protein